MTQLRNLTKEEKNQVFVPGTIVSYEDMSNHYQEWAIVRIEETRWGTNAILWNENGEQSLSINAGFQNGWKLVKTQ